MLRQIKIQKSNNPFNVYYVSCLHLGHDRDFIFKPRGFKSVQEHDTVIVKRWNNTITNDDTVISLGDTIFGINTDTRLIEYFRKLNFKTLYISPGNHTSGWRELYIKAFTEKYKLIAELKDNKFPSIEIYPLEWKPFIGIDKTIFFMPNFYEAIIFDQPIVLSHFPIASWNGQSKGVWHICGHTHGHYIPTTKNQTDGKMIDVCVENFGGPVSHSEINRIMSRRTINIVDHHSKIS